MTPGDEIQLVVFRVGAQHFALNIFQVERILRYQEPTPLPSAPDFLEGMFAYGDGAVPLIDLRKRLGAPAPIRDETRVMVLELDVGRIGVVADAVLEVKKLAAEAIAPPAPLVQGLAAEFISGIARLDGRTLVVLAVNKLLSSPERVALEALTVEVPHE
ncbi:MAG TPA: chemotaxis protein CheW [Gemmatimonadales bacterium]|nr:chemotaxis protein CheW [Gemmatimonadales bacterium]